MTGSKKKILFLTDLNYAAKARTFYGEEDVFLTNRLRREFDLAICDIPSARSFEDHVDLIVVRNIGAVSYFHEEYFEFRKRVKEKKLNIYNEFNGIGDQIGKQYLIDFSNDGYPVIPSVDKLSDLYKLGDNERYCIKPKNGADSNGIKFPFKDELVHMDLPDGEYIIQPWIDFEYEVSFYFINDKFEYAMYAPDKSKRWELKPYPYNEEDIAYAEEFINLSPVKKGIQRIDACRTKDGKLLLMELEDLNPYLSLDLLSDDTREMVITDIITAIKEML